MLGPHTSNLKFVPLPLHDTHTVLDCSFPHPSLKCSRWLLFKPFRCFQVVVFLKFYWVSHFQGHICPRRSGLGHILDSAFDFFSKEPQRPRIVVGRGSIPGPESGLLSNTWKWIIWKDTSTDKTRDFTVSPLHMNLQVANFQKWKGVFACAVTKLFTCLACIVTCVHPLQVAVVLCTLQCCIEYRGTVTLFQAQDVLKQA